jgi:hypothetical protein
MYEVHARLSFDVVFRCLSNHPEGLQHAGNPREQNFRCHTINKTAQPSDVANKRFVGCMT